MIVWEFSPIIDYNTPQALSPEQTDNMLRNEEDGCVVSEEMAAKLKGASCSEYLFNISTIEHAIKHISKASRCKLPNHNIYWKLLKPIKVIRVVKREVYVNLNTGGMYPKIQPVPHKLKFKLENE